MSNVGEVTIKFTRPVIFPNELLKGFDSDYVEDIPILTPTEAEIKELRKLYDKEVAIINEEIAKAEENAANELKTEIEPSQTESDTTIETPVTDCGPG